MKKTICLFLTALLLAFSLSSCMEVESPVSTEQLAETNMHSESTLETSAPKKEEDSSLGMYAVTIDSYRFAWDYQGQPIVIIKYIFSNVSDSDAVAFCTTLSASVFQNGIGLNECYTVDDSANFSSDNQYREIKKGASLPVEVAYTLNDTTSDLEIEVSEYFSWSNKTVCKTFQISSEGGTTPDMPALPATGNLGKYNVEIDSYRLAYDYMGKPIVIIKYLFSNVNDSSPAAFAWTIDALVFQNGIGLNQSYFLDDDSNYNYDDVYKEVRKDSTLAVEVAYELIDTTTSLEVEASLVLSWDNKTVTKTFDLQ